MNELKGRFAILLSCFLWGTTGVAASFAPNVSSLAIGAFSMGVGGLLLMLTSMRSLQQDWHLLWRCRVLVVVGALAVVVYPLAFYSSMRLAGVAVGNVVSLASAPFFAIGFECLISKKRPSFVLLLSLAIGSAGIVLLALQKGEAYADAANNHLQGIVLGLLAGLSYGLYSWTAKRMIMQGVKSQSAMGSMFGLASIVLITTLFFTGEQIFASQMSTGVVLYIALVPMFIGYLAFGYGLGFVPASSATLMTLFEPVVATVLAIVVLGEVVTALGWLGMVFIMVCLLLQLTVRQNNSPD